MALGTSLLGGLGAAGGAGNLGTLFVRLRADSAGLIAGMNHAEAAIAGGSARINASVTKMAVGVTAALAAIGAFSVKAAADFEESFAGVRKTVNATEAEFKMLEEAFRGMAKELPVSVNEINRVAEAAGQLGIKTANLQGFTKVMIDLGNTTNLTSDQAATALARLANITQMPQENFDRLGSTIVALGNNLATTEAEIVDMALRIAGAGNIVGLTEAEIVSLSASLSSVGIQAEAGGTAISQAMIKMATAVGAGSKELDVFARVAGMTTQEFSKAFQEDAIQAIQAFILGLGDMREQGEDVFGTLDQLGLDGIRLTDVMLRLSGAGDLLSDSLAIGNRAWRDNSALVEEAEKRYGTFWSQLKITWNIINDIFITIGQELIPVLKALNEMLQDAATSTGNLNGSMSTWTQTIAPAFITVIGLIGDAIFGWQVLVKSLQLVFSIMAQKVGEAFDFILDKATSTIATLLKVFNRLQSSMNLIPGFGETNVAPVANFLRELNETVDRGNQAVADTVAQNQRELDDLVNKGKFSDRLLEKWEAATRGVEKENKELVEDVKKTVEEVNAQLAKVSATEVTNTINRMHMEAFGGAGQAGTFKGIPSLDPNVSQLRELQADQTLAEEQLAILQSLQEQEVQLTAETQAKKLELLNAYTEQVRALQLVQASIILSSAEQMFGDLAGIAESFGQRQSGVYKGLFAASKAFAVADATVKIAQGVAAAASLPFPSNIAAMASVVAATASIIQSIQAVQLEFGGERQSGGPVSPGKAFLVGEAGPELFTPGRAGNIIPNDQLGGSRVNVVVNNYSDATATVTERDNGDEKTIEVMIARTKNSIASEIREGRGDVTKSMQSSFGLRRAGK